MESDKAIEQELQDKGLTAPRVTPAQIEELLAGVTYHFHVVPPTTTVCTAVDAMGFSLATVISACASPENFNAEMGEKIARQKAQCQAREALWQLEGYHLKKTLAKQAGEI